MCLFSFNYITSNSKQFPRSSFFKHTWNPSHLSNSTASHLVQVIISVPCTSEAVFQQLILLPQVPLMISSITKVVLLKLVGSVYPHALANA